MVCGLTEWEYEKQNLSFHVKKEEGDSKSASKLEKRPNSISRKYKPLQKPGD